MFRFFAFLLCLTGIVRAVPLDLRLPTENHHLLTGEPDQFYQYVDRNFEGVASKPWEAGSYGYVRTAVRINGEVLLTKFHEGIDISPVKRDKAGNPLDLVSSIADGRVVYINSQGSRGDYGKYVVIEHEWENSGVISLYAHLAEITVKPGDEVKAGSVIGRMGYTGTGITRVRAHCHLELGMLMSTRYDDWHKAYGGGINYHGNYHGWNITGGEVARFFLEHQTDPERKFSDFIAATPVYFKVTAPSTGKIPDFVKRYPWITHAPADDARSWQISFSATGLPVAFEPSQSIVDVPLVTSVRPSAIPHRLHTRGLITGEGNNASLSASGLKLVALLMDNFPPAPLPTSHDHR